MQGFYSSFAPSWGLKNVYVEPFVGSGAVFFRKEPSQREVINDIDKKMMNAYALIKPVSSDPNKYKKYENLDALAGIKRFFNTVPFSKEDRLTHYITQSCNTFISGLGSGEITKDSNPYHKLANIDKYKQRMQNTTTRNTDYRTIVGQYDSKDTLFYLDPPYEDSKKDKSTKIV